MNLLGVAFCVVAVVAIPEQGLGAVLFMWIGTVENERSATVGICERRITVSLSSGREGEVRLPMLVSRFPVYASVQTSPRAPLKAAPQVVEPLATGPPLSGEARPHRNASRGCPRRRREADAHCQVLLRSWSLHARTEALSKQRLWARSIETKYMRRKKVRRITLIPYYLIRPTR